MKKIFVPVLLFMVTVSLSSCNQQPKEEQEFDALMEKVIGVHDEVMPKLGEISALIKKMKPKIDTTTASKPYKNAEKELKRSYDSMMEWMSDFSKKFPYDQENSFSTKEEYRAKMDLLKEEDVEINKVKDQINYSIDLAKKLLEKP